MYEITFGKPLNVHVCICTYMYVYECIYEITFGKPLNVHVCICAYMYVYECMYEITWSKSLNVCVYVYICVCTYTYIPMYTYLCVCVCVYLCVYVCVYRSKCCNSSNVCLSQQNEREESTKRQPLPTTVTNSAVYASYKTKATT